MDTTKKLADFYEALEGPMERLVERCNNAGDLLNNTEEVIAAEAALERLYRARKAGVTLAPTPNANKLALEALEFIERIAANKMVNFGTQIDAIKAALSTPAAADAPEPAALTDGRKLPASHYLIDPSMFTVAPWDPTPWMIACGESASAGGRDIGAAYKAMLAGGQMHPAMMAESPFIVGGTALVGGDLAASQPAPVEENVLDLDKAFWEQLLQAAKESSWIPQEHYFVNDWVNDCCNFLRTGDSTVAAPVEAQAVVVPEWHKALAAAEGGNLLARFIEDNEPAEDAREWRESVRDMLQQVSGRPAVLEEDIDAAAPTPSKGEAQQPYRKSSGESYYDRLRQEEE